MKRSLSAIFRRLAPAKPECKAPQTVPQRATQERPEKKASEAQPHLRAAPTNSSQWGSVGESNEVPVGASKSERLRLLEAAVTETMAQLGFLSSSFNYRVISTSETGLSYILLMRVSFDLELFQETLFADAEYVLRERAMTVYGITIREVYWRRSERLALSGNTYIPSMYSQMNRNSDLAPLTEPGAVSRRKQSARESAFARL